jgi:predicted O-methyltransferase YrrM
MATAPITADTFARIFDIARQKEYPAIDALESEFGQERYAIGRMRLEDAAKILACPMKQHPPHWQHGRVIYAVARAYLHNRREIVSLIDVGTAKGFSALCLQWALNDSQALGSVVSTDVLDPKGTERRNSVLELDGPKTLAQFLEPWPEAGVIDFRKGTGQELIASAPGRIHLAFIDGKHSYEHVKAEGKALADRQSSGDYVIWDDCQIPEVARAVAFLRAYYDVTEVQCCEYRTYAIGVRR